MRRASAAVVLWVVLAVPALAQTLGTITGEVKDSTGAVVPGATVTVVNKATNATRTTASNDVGLFDFPALPPGHYTVKSELDGFKTTSRDLELQVQQTARVDFTLELGTISEMATVTGVSPLVETSNATIGTVIENRRIVELPLNGSNYLQLVALSPNVSAEFAGAGQAGDRQGGTRANQQLSISGQRREFNYYTLDGVDNTDVNFNTYIFLPSVDALEEFKVQTGVYSAEFGREASQVNVVTKVGHQQPARHAVRIPPQRRVGRADPTRSRRRRRPPPKAPFKWNQYGYTAGGPVWKNHLFFMSNFEGYRRSETVPDLYSVPSAAMRERRLLGAAGATSAQSTRRPGNEPASSSTRRSAPSSARRGRCAPFPGNIIPASRLNAISKKLLEFYPEPNNGGGGLHQQLSVAAGSRHRQEPVHAAHGSGAELAIGVDGPLQLRQGERGRHRR